MRKVVPRCPKFKNHEKLLHSEALSGIITNSTLCRHETITLIVYWQDAHVDFSFSFGHFDPFFFGLLLAKSQAESTYVEATWFNDEIGCTIAILQVCDGHLSIHKSSLSRAASLMLTLKMLLPTLLMFSHQISLILRSLSDRMVSIHGALAW